MIAIARGQIWNAEALYAPVDREEASVVARAKTGDDSAYRWLLSRYRERAVRLASAVLRRSAEAEDVAQDAFIRAFRSLDSLRSDGGFGPWLFRIVVRLCVDRTRSARWCAQSCNLDEAASREGCGSPETAVMIDALLASLTPPLRAALVLREIEGLEYEEIAAVLAIPVGTVRSRLSAARQEFRRLWREGEEDTDQ